MNLRNDQRLQIQVARREQNAAFQELAETTAKWERARKEANNAWIRYDRSVQKTERYGDGTLKAALEYQIAQDRASQACDQLGAAPPLRKGTKEFSDCVHFEDLLNKARRRWDQARERYEMCEDELKERYENMRSTSEKAAEKYEALKTLSDRANAANEQLRFLLNECSQRGDDTQGVGCPR